MMYKLNFFVPEAHLESVKTACIKAGAGKIGPYVRCAWQTLGTTQYQPTEESKPYQGIAGKLETTREFSVHMMMEEEQVASVLKALLEAHPYESPVYGVWKVLRIEDF